MDIISSTKNEKLKNISALLKTKKARDEQGVFVIEGSRLISSFFDASKESEAGVISTDSFSAAA